MRSILLLTIVSTTAFATPALAMPSTARKARVDRREKPIAIWLRGHRITAAVQAFKTWRRIRRANVPAPTKATATRNLGAAFGKALLGQEWRVSADGYHFEARGRGYTRQIKAARNLVSTRVSTVQRSPRDLPTGEVVDQAKPLGNGRYLSFGSTSVVLGGKRSTMRSLSEQSLSGKQLKNLSGRLGGRELRFPASWTSK